MNLFFFLGGESMESSMNDTFNESLYIKPTSFGLPSPKVLLRSVHELLHGY